MSSKPVASFARLFWGLLFVLAVFGPRTSRASQTGIADVTYVSSDRSYVDAGQLDGVRAGQVLSLERGGIEVGRVEIVTVGDHTASIRIRTGGGIKTGDKIVYEIPAKKPTRIVLAAAQERVPRETLASLWIIANEGAPPVAVRYEKVDTGHGAATVSGQAETDYHLYTYFNQGSLTRHEQHFSFSTRGENLGTEGLEVRLRGQVLARYDDTPDLYLDGRRGIPLIRELAVLYHPKKRHFFGAVGRFSPQMPQASLVDGVEAGFDARSVRGAVFGGLRPNNADLLPSVHRQTFGAVVGFRPRLHKLDFETDEGVTADLHDGNFTRTAVTIDNRFSAGARVFASQIATFDFLGADDNGKSVSNFAVSLLGLDVNCRINRRATLDVRGRYDEQTVFQEDVTTLSDQWIAALRGRRHGRAEAGLSTRSEKGNEWRPFLFGLGDFDNGIDTAYTGAGFQWSDDSLLSTRTRMTTSFDFGFGTGQTANINLSFVTPFLKERLTLRSGLFNTWKRNQDSSINTLSHLLFLVLNGRIVNGLDLFADLSAAYDHALVRLTYPFGGRMQFQLGASYTW